MPTPTNIVPERHAPHGATRPLAGIFLLVASAWALSGLDASGKWVMGAGVPLLIFCWMRYVIHLALVLVLILPVKGIKALRSIRRRDQMIRGALMLASTLSFFTALSYLPQAEATAINFLAPLIILSLAPWLLQEPGRLSRWLAAGIGLCGVLIIVRPGGGLDPIGTMFALLSACLMAGQSMATRRVAADNAFTTLIWSGAVGSICLTLILPFVLPHALPILAGLSPLQWVVLTGTGVLGALGHLLQIQAYQHAPASLLAPFVYFQIISAATLGWLVWGQFPDTLSWTGIAIICISGIGIAAYEWRTRETRQLAGSDRKR